MKTLNPGGFLIHPGGYRNLYCYKRSVILYDMTFLQEGGVKERMFAARKDQRGF